MVLMNLIIDNLCGFHNFEVTFSYPKKVVDSTIPEEHLKDFPNFRYKKVNIIMGANAAGKTSLGNVIMGVFNFTLRRDPSLLKSFIGFEDKNAKVIMDAVFDGKTLTRITIELRANDTTSGSFDRNNAEVYTKAEQTVIRARDNYETAASRLDKEQVAFSTNYAECFKDIRWFGWIFTFPRDQGHATNRISSSNRMFTTVLRKVMKSLDIAITDIVRMDDKDKGNTFLITTANQKEGILIHNGEIQESGISHLSSGTRAGIDIAVVLSEILEHSAGFYYIDEKFSYIQTDIEKATVSVMISCLEDNEQLFFTTHNTDILDLDLPFHSFLMLKKEMSGGIPVITARDASYYIKKNNISLKNSVENDLMSTQPDLSEIYSLEKLNKKAGN